MKFISQPADIAPEEAAARFTRATELLMLGAERRRAAQGAHGLVAAHAHPIPDLPRITANGRFVRRETQAYPQIGGAA